MRDLLLWAVLLLGAVLLLLVGWLWACSCGAGDAQAADVTLAWDPPPAGATASRVYQSKAGECVLNASQYLALEPDILAPAAQATLTVEEGSGYCFLVRYIDQAGQAGLPSYVVGVKVPPAALPPPQQLRLPAGPGR